MRGLKSNFEATLAILIITLSGVIISVCFTGISALGLMIFPLLLTKRLINIHRKSAKKIEFMFKALECNDYSFEFIDSRAGAEEQATNELLNKIKELLAQAKLYTIEQNKYYEHIVNSVNTGILIVNESGNIFQSNKAIKKILGIEILTHLNQVAKVSQNLVEQIQIAQPSESLQATITNEWGDSVLILTSSRVTLNNNVFKLIAINNVDNLLSQKEMESWSKLTRILTHEIMNSLAPITSLSETLIDMNSDPNIHKGLETIYQTNKSLTSFVDNYRKFTRIQQPIKSPFEIKTLIENLSSILLNSDIQFTLNVEPENTMLYADENQVFQVLVNILKNGVDAIKNQDHKKVWIDVYIRKDENIVIDISNNGKAIDPSALDNIFIPFFTTKSGGKGIGLAISKQIMQLHGGSLSVSSNHDGQVTFSLLFK